MIWLVILIFGFVVYIYWKHLQKQKTKKSTVSYTDTGEKVVTYTVKVDIDKALNNRTPLTFKSAIAGTYDESYFINPQTGNFRFPKYITSDHKFMIKIADETDYKGFYDLSPKERQRYGIKGFEINFIDPDIYIKTTFWDMFDRTKPNQLKPYEFLHGSGQSLQELSDDISSNEYIYEDDYLTKELFKRDMLTPVDLTEEEKHQHYLQAMVNIPFAKLRDICKNNGLKPPSKKQEIIQLILQNNIRVDIPPLPREGLLNEKFHQLMEYFYNLYIDDIKIQIDRWHPLYHPFIWQAVIGEAECEAVDIKVREILESKYWEDRLKDIQW